MLGINANSVVNSHTHTNMLVNTVLRPINSALKGRYAHWNAIIAIRFLLFTVRHKNTIFDQHREALPRFPALFFFFWLVFALVWFASDLNVSFRQIVIS